MFFFIARMYRVFLRKSWWKSHHRLYERLKRDLEKKQKLATEVMREQKEEKERLARIRAIEFEKIQDKAKQKAQRAIMFVLLCHEMSVCNRIETGWKGQTSGGSVCV